MRTTRSNFVFGLGIMLLVALACKFSATTAKHKQLKLGKKTRLLVARPAILVRVTQFTQSQRFLMPRKSSK